MILEHQSNNKKILFIIFILFLLVGIYLLVKQMTRKDERMVSCTMEAKLCEDGSSVGRTGPNCEFSECPDIDEEGWKTYVDKENNIEYKLP